MLDVHEILHEHLVKFKNILATCGDLAPAISGYTYAAVAHLTRQQLAKSTSKQLPKSVYLVTAWISIITAFCWYCMLMRKLKNKTCNNIGWSWRFFPGTTLSWFRPYGLEWKFMSLNMVKVGYILTHILFFITIVRDFFLHQYCF